MSSYHGWTHRPKAQGGTDPVGGNDFTVRRAALTGGAATVTTATGFDLDTVYPFTSYFSDDTAETYFEHVPDDGNGFEVIQINQRGVYTFHYRAVITWRTAGTNPTHLIPAFVRLSRCFGQAGTVALSPFDYGAFNVSDGGGEFSLANMNAGEELVLGSSVTEAFGDLGATGSGYPNRWSMYIKSENGAHDWGHSSALFQIIRIADCA